MGNRDGGKDARTHFDKLHSDVIPKQLVAPLNGYLFFSILDDVIPLLEVALVFVALYLCKQSINKKK